MTHELNICGIDYSRKSSCMALSFFYKGKPSYEERFWVTKDHSFSAIDYYPLKAWATLHCDHFFIEGLFGNKYLDQDILEMIENIKRLHNKEPEKKPMHYYLIQPYEWRELIGLKTRYIDFEKYLQCNYCTNGDCQSCLRYLMKLESLSFAEILINDKLMWSFDESDSICIAHAGYIKITGYNYEVDHQDKFESYLNKSSIRPYHDNNLRCLKCETFGKSQCSFNCPMSHFDLEDKKKYGYFHYA